MEPPPLINHEIPSLADLLVEKNPQQPEQTELADAPSIDEVSAALHSSGSLTQQTSGESQKSKKTSSDFHRQVDADTPIGTAQLLAAGIWIAGLRRRVDSLKQSPTGKIMVRVEVSPFEIELPDWMTLLSWEANYHRIVAQVKGMLASEVHFTLTEIPKEPTPTNP